MRTRCPRQLIRYGEMLARTAGVCGRNVAARATVVRCINTKSTSYDTLTKLLLDVKQLPTVWKGGKKTRVVEKEVVPIGYDFVSESSDAVKRIMDCNANKQYDEMLSLITAQYESKQLLSAAIVLQIVDVNLSDPATVGIERPIEELPFEIDLKHQLMVYFDIVKMYMPYMKGVKQFQEKAIQLCYHVGEVETLDDMSEAYLKNEDLNQKTLNYILNGYALNYEVESAKEKVGIITNVCHDLDVSILDTVVLLFIKVGALYESLTNVLQTWMYSRNPLPSARTMSGILSQTQKYGTLEELKEMENLILRYGLQDHYLVQLVQIKYKITNRHKTLFKKMILQEDIEEISRLVDSLFQTASKEELTECYYILMDFFVRYSTLESVKFVLSKMKEHDVAMNSRFKKLFMKNYLIHEQYMSLIGFVMKTKQSFSPEMLITTFEALVRTYPFYAQEFYAKYLSFVKRSSLPESLKEVIINKMAIHPLKSHSRPFGFGDESLNPKRYKSKKWQPMSNLKGSKTSLKAQGSFRVTKGFEEVLLKGLKPDLKLIEQAFRSGNLRTKTDILQLAQNIRMQAKDQNRLSMINLTFATSEEIRRFVTFYGDTLNSNNKVSLARILTNKNMHEESLLMLNSIFNSDISHNSSMVVLNYKLLPLYLLKDYQQIINELDKFPISKTILSPYIIDKSCQLKARLENLKLKSDSPDIDKCIQKLDQFITECTTTLQQQKLILDQETTAFFQYLNDQL